MSEEMIYLRWLDSALNPEWTRAPNEETGLAKIETVGYLIHEDEQHVEIAQSSNEDYRFGAILSIPQSVILERRVLKMGKAKKVCS